MNVARLRSERRASRGGSRMKAETLFDYEAPHPPTNARRTARQRRAGRIRVQYSFSFFYLLDTKSQVTPHP